MLEMLGVRGSHVTNPGENAGQLAKVVTAGVLAAKLSHCATLAAGYLFQSYMENNRFKSATFAATPVAVC